MRESAVELDVAEAGAYVPAPRDEVAGLFWDIRAWHAIWLQIDDVDVLYDDGAHQEFVMGVQRDGRHEEVRTIRYLRDNGDIDFFSPQPPPTMTIHNGRWAFSEEAERPGGCRVTARREYHLTREAGETEDGYRVRRRDYAERFSIRLRAILDSFVEHYAKRHTPHQKGDGMTRCTESIHVDASPQSVGAFLLDVHNLPRWTGFFRSVGAPAGDRHEVQTAIGTTIRTRIEHRDDEHYTISSLVGDREERAELLVATTNRGTRVSFTIELLPAMERKLSEGADGADGAEVQRERMLGELQRLRDAVSEGAKSTAAKVEGAASTAAEDGSRAATPAVEHRRLAPLAEP